MQRIFVLFLFLVQRVSKDSKKEKVQGRALLVETSENVRNNLEIIGFGVVTELLYFKRISVTTTMKNCLLLRAVVTSRDKIAQRYNRPRCKLEFVFPRKKKRFHVTSRQGYTSVSRKLRRIQTKLNFEVEI